MAVSHGSNADFYCNGYVLSPFLTSASFSGSRDTAETTTFKKKSKTYIPGLKDTTMSAEGVWDGDVDAVDQVFQASLVADPASLVSYLPLGNEVIGNMVYTMDSQQTTYEINTDIGDVAQCSAEFDSGNFGQFGRGRVNLPFAVQAAPGNGTGLDGVASSTNGMNLIVHAVAAASLVVKIQDSTTLAGTYADVAGAVINVPSGRSSTRLFVPGTVRRFTRILWTGTGTFVAITERL